MRDLLNHPYAVHPDASTTMVGGEMVILHLESGVYFGLDKVGTKIWDGITDGQSMNDICSTIAKGYGEPREQVEQDARSFLKDLLEADLIVVAGTGAGN